MWRNWRSSGTILPQTQEPDHVVDHYPTACGDCHQDLEASRLAGTRRCQTFDLPQPAGWDVTEH
ncbi:hypothetical protein [Nocardiopsis valliformis]|uniref:hypothetical protein n=1 Tax=Nocardiopsis valliformis TaxID=239974 RepID=UPI0003735AFA|nr:hypothetical protein [Nocardiopsis valliformis]